jgi:glutamate racemase
MNGECVGMLDWGIGGLGCYRIMREARPDLSLLYCSDSGAVPYGRLPRKALRERVESVAHTLVRMGATRVVVACNAASTVLPEVRCEAPLSGVIEQAIAMIPGSLTGTLGVLGGVRTVRSGVYQRALSSARLTVQGRVAQPLSAHIEAGTTESAACREALRAIMRPLARADALLLACTHYPAIASAILAHAPEARLFDPAEALAAHTLGLLGGRCASGGARFLTTGDPAAMRRAAARAWGLSLPRIDRVRVGTARGTS